MDRELMQETATLYALAPAAFVEARKTRAKKLRPEQAELAAQIAKLPKPSVAAAAINRVARDDPSEMRSLVQAGRALRSAQESALSGKSAGAIAVTTREHRAALERVLREARRLELSGAVLERVASTLRAASVDPELQPLLERGTLGREVESAGFGLDPGLVASAPTPKPKRKASERTQAAAQARAALAAARDELAEAKREAAAAERERKRLAKELDGAEKDVEKTQAAVAKAERAVDGLRGRS